MPKKDVYHDIVKDALIKDGWGITHDPLTLSFGRRNIYVDLGAEQIIAAEKEGQKIAIEIKSFLGDSEINDLEKAIGQYLLYRVLLSQSEPERTLYLAITDKTYRGIFNEPLGGLVIANYEIKLIVFDEFKGVVIRWIH